jgi:hypothetical protein
MLNIDREVETLKRMAVGGLREKYLEVFREPSRSGNKQFLWRRIAWRLQALEEGDLSERARRRAMELAKDADLRIRPPKGACGSSWWLQGVKWRFHGRSPVPRQGASRSLSGLSTPISFIPPQPCPSTLILSLPLSHSP